jgi:hypothetical protein
MSPWNTMLGVRNIKRKKFFFWSVTVLMTAVLVLAAGEILARLFVTPRPLPVPPPPGIIDPYKANPFILQVRPYLFFHIPRSKYTQARSNYRVEYAFNARGFRGQEIPERKTGDPKRLVVIGDSSVEGQGVPFEKTFTPLLNHSLRKRGWEAIHAAGQGGCPIYYAANLERYLALEPDAVLLVINENDLLDDRCEEVKYFEIPVLHEARDWLLGESNRGWHRVSRLWWLFERVSSSFTGYPLDDIVKKNLEIPHMNREQERLNELAPFLVAPSLFDTQWRKSLRYLDRFASECGRRKIPIMVTSLCVITLVPGIDEAFQEHAQQLNDRISRWTKEEGLPFFSMLPAITQALEEHSIYDLVIEDDGHPTAMCHALVERTLRPWIIENIEMLSGDSGPR